MHRGADRQELGDIENLIHPKPVDLKILMALSTNARESAAEIGKRVGLSSTAAKYRISKLEKTYDIKYTIQIAERPFGFFRYAIFVKFIGKKPNSAEVKESLEKIPWIQLVAITSGEYDLFIYLFAENTHKLEELVYFIRSETHLSRYKSYWYVNYMTDAYGYVPLREEFFDVLKERVWRRTKETKRRPHNTLLGKEYEVLKLLNANSNANFSAFDKQQGLNEGSTDYIYHKLLENGIIHRATITMINPPIKYNLIVYGIQTDIFKFNLKRKHYLLDVIDDTNTPTNRYTLTADIGSPYGVVHILPIYNETDLEQLENVSKQMKDSVDFKYFQVMQTIIGNWGYRKIDNTTTRQYKILTKLP